MSGSSVTEKTTAKMGQMNQTIYVEVRDIIEFDYKECYMFKNLSSSFVA